MRHLISIFFLLCFSFFVTMAQDDDIADFPYELSDVQELDELIEGNIRLSRLSPNGNLIGYEGDNGLCVYNFTTEENTCFPFPQENSEGEFIQYPRISNFSWSQDSTQIAIMTPALLFFIDADIWVLNIETGDYTNFTDDGYEGSLPLGEEDSEGLFVDILPTWSSTGDLYFFRYADFPIETMTTKLYRIPSDEQEPELVADYTSQVEASLTFYDIATVTTFDGNASISPDGTQMAVFYRDIGLENHAIWIINLEDGSVQEVIDISRSYDIGLPDWSEVTGDLQTIGIGWIDNISVVFSTVSMDFSTMPFWMIYSVDIPNNDIQAVFDYSDVSSLSELMEIDNAYHYPNFAVAVPNSSYLLFTENPSLAPTGISVIPVAGEDVTRVYEFEENNFIRALFASIGSDGQTVRALLEGVVYTFTVIDSE